ncbi:MAG: hypothetical protein IPG61_20235 [bacterium]|nr:hypothetical protein [bacterium]
MSRTPDSAASSSDSSPLARRAKNDVGGICLLSPTTTTCDPRRTAPKASSGRTWAGLVEDDEVEPRPIRRQEHGHGHGAHHQDRLDRQHGLPAAFHEAADRQVPLLQADLGGQNPHGAAARPARQGGVVGRRHAGPVQAQHTAVHVGEAGNKLLVLRRVEGGQQAPLGKRAPKQPLEPRGFQDPGQRRLVGGPFVGDGAQRGQAGGHDLVAHGAVADVVPQALGVGQPGVEQRVLRGDGGFLPAGGKQLGAGREADVERRPLLPVRVEGAADLLRAPQQLGAEGRREAQLQDFPGSSASLDIAMERQGPRGGRARDVPVGLPVAPQPTQQAGARRRGGREVRLEPLRAVDGLEQRHQRCERERLRAAQQVTAERAGTTERRRQPAPPAALEPPEHAGGRGHVRLPGAFTECRIMRAMELVQHRARSKARLHRRLAGQPVGASSAARSAQAGPSESPVASDASDATCPTWSGAGNRRARASPVLLSHSRAAAAVASCNSRSRSGRSIGNSALGRQPR